MLVFMILKNYFFLRKQVGALEIGRWINMFFLNKHVVHLDVEK
jgi:hypothetical protein